MVLRPNINLVLPRFLFAFLTSNDVLTELQHLAETRSGTFPQITFSSELASMPISVPCLDEQQKIAGILSSLDEKIELNNHINENLEAQIRSIYTQLSKEILGKAIMLSEVLDIRDGTHDSPKFHKEGFPLITSKHLLPFGVNISNANLISKEDYEKINKRSKVETYDILISMIGTVGLISLVIEEKINFAIKNVGLLKTSAIPKYALFIFEYLNSAETIQHIGKCLAGTTQKYISLGELRKMTIKLPDDRQLEKFNTIARPIVAQISNFIFENRKLGEIRDTLLPRLMSGELDVSEIDI